ncbi:Translation initiation factor 3 subunit J component [Scheffersomyces spartinae]|uniref:Eukaryotic translation initiation factor 3 subunit J n=1 Tax=Scheffersomyces spartinae TaxID=45513 RepID=A0A9P7VCY8_9ASCO|nr:Translation initiation factor 3 subunit J component [Scheffersomyces spartinae]KAG7195517.1 Translation initiation factor 3 subunit J component [Scheffersomyces spartinae]
MSWDDEDFDIPSAGKDAVLSWEDEGDDEPLLEESWDVDEEEVARKKKEAEDQKKAEREALKKKQDEAKAKKLHKKSGERTLMEIDELDEETRKELLKQAELQSDLNNAADLFGGLGVAGDDDFDINAHPRERLAKLAAAAKANQSKSGPKLTKDTPLSAHPIFQPTDKAEFEKLRKALSTTLTELSEDSLLNYSSGLAIDLIRDVAKPLSLENVRKVVSTLNVLIKDKEKAERQARLLKAGGTATGGAGKKKAKPAVKTNVSNFKKDEFEDLSASYDDFGDDDFM